MKKKLLGAMALTMVAVMCLGGCKNKAADGGQAQESGQGASLESTTGADEKKDASADNAADTQKYDTPVTIVNHHLSCKVGDKEYASGIYPEIVLSDEYKKQYPKLAERISEYNFGWSNNTPEMVSEYAKWAQEDTFYEDPDYSSELRVSVVRADDRIFTMIASFYEFAGGAHPNHGSYSINIDPVTGSDIKLKSVLADTSYLAASVRSELGKAYTDYDGLLEEVDSFYFPDDEEPADVFQQKLDNDTYSWNIDEKGLNIFFSPYEIASYATGYLEVLLPVSEYPDLLQKAYVLDKAQNLEEMVKEVDGEVQEIEPKVEEPTPDSVRIENPTWKRYLADGVTAGTNHISLTQTKEDKTDWLDTSVWAEKHGFEVEYLSHEDDNYYYTGSDPYEYEYMYQHLQVYDKDMQKMYYDFDLLNLCNGPDLAEGRLSNAAQFVKYATLIDNILYVELGHSGYASEESWSSYIVAIDVNTNEVIFRSEPLVANGDNFCIVDDTIICGYGFTAEPDYIYLLDRFTGEKYDTIPVNSAAYQFKVVGDTLYVATYNTAYEYTITH